MSSKPVDLTRLTVEDIFRAKEERRKRLAKLPFEEKIRIVKRLQTVSAAIKGEKTIFYWFLKACPDFAGEPIAEWDKVEEWYAKRSITPPAYPYDRRPDIIARTVSGKTIGVELKSWINRDQIASTRSSDAPKDRLDTLRDTLLAHRSDPRCQALKAHARLDECYLLVHYDFNGFTLKTFNVAPDLRFMEAAKFAVNVLAGDGGNFDRIFVFNFLFGKQEGYQVFPPAI